MIFLAYQNSQGASVFINTLWVSLWAGRGLLARLRRSAIVESAGAALRYDVARAVASLGAKRNAKKRRRKGRTPPFASVNNATMAAGTTEGRKESSAHFWTSSELGEPGHVKCAAPQRAPCCRWRTPNALHSGATVLLPSGTTDNQRTGDFLLWIL